MGPRLEALRTIENQEYQSKAKFGVSETRFSTSNLRNVATLDPSVTPRKSTVQHNYNYRSRQVDENAPPPVNHAVQPAAKSKPSKRKEKLSALCKTPPSIVRNPKGQDYQRGIFLGEGGFARCFQMKDDNGQIFAAKTVAKASLKGEKTRTKLLSEIKVHKCLDHPNIVQFIDCFEDDLNVYILLEICPNQSLMDMLKKRKRLTETEVKFFLIQIIGAIKYMHSRRVIHRDLKLGNIFFDDKMNLKIGDFGLAAVLADDSDRKRTICGTPNYIAPEVLYGKEHGHSYEVDIWSIGIMLYALLIGKPPFQSKDVNEIYKKIKHNQYTFPPDVEISEDAEDLIRMILATNPEDRPSLDEIINHNFFKYGFPSRIFTLSLTREPPYAEISAKDSQYNFSRALKKAGLVLTESSSKEPVRILDKDLHAEKPKAILPHSLSPGNTSSKYKLVSVTSVEKGIPLQNAQNPEDRRIYEDNIIPNGNDNDGTDNVTSQIRRRSNWNRSRSAVNYTAASGLDGLQSRVKTTSNFDIHSQVDQERKPHGLKRSLNQHLKSVGSKSVSSGSSKRLLISKWVDYSNKLGFSYQFSNGEIGVLFTDGSTIVVPGSSHIEGFRYIGPKTAGYPNRWYKMSEVDTESRSIGKKLSIIQFFSNYMKTNLRKVVEEENTENGENQCNIFVVSFQRSPEYTMFQLSDGSYQFNFADHKKIWLSDDGTNFTFIALDKSLYSYRMSDLDLIEDIPDILEKRDLNDKLDTIFTKLRNELQDDKPQISHRALR